MESKKINWNRLLNIFIASVGLILASLFIGICFIIPVASVKAVTKDTILNDYNIYFVSAKTKIRQADAYNKVYLSDNPQEKLPDFYSYQYNYLDDSNINLYRSENANTLYGSNNGQVILSSNLSELKTVQKYNRGSYNYSTNGFIPNNVTYFENCSGELEEIFYDSIDDGDFVLLDNYSNLNSTNNTFNVENFYLSFGTPYIDELVHTTPLHELKVDGKLYTKDRVHILNLNDVNTYEYTISEGSNVGNKVNLDYWFQYFDLRNLEGKQTAEQGAETYSIENQEGKYEITFRFIRYDDSFSPVSEIEESFTYTFYLLDSADYDEYPEIFNSTLGSVEYDQVNEYFYNFTNDTPYISYNPSKYNLSYTRENRDILESITSTFSLGTYKIGGNVYPKGIITYYNNGEKIKEVYILVYYNSDKTIVEYLYLANNNGATISSEIDYTGFERLLASDTLTFEYKLTDKLEINKESNTTTYTTTRYKTTSYNNHKLSTETEYYDDIVKDTSIIIKVVEGNAETYYDSTISNENIISKIEITKTDNLIENLSSGVTLKLNDLTETSTITVDSTKYQLNSNTITKTYLDASKNESTTSDITLNTETDGTFEINDPVHNYITIQYVVSNNTITSVIFYINNNFKTTNTTLSNLNNLNSLLNLEAIDIDYSYDLYFDELGIYNFNYSYVCPTYNSTTLSNTYIINNSSNSTNITTPTNYSVTLEENNPIEQNLVEGDDLLLEVWGYLDANNEVTLNGIKYNYNSTNNQISSSHGTIDLNTSSIGEQTINGNKIDCEYSISKTLDGIKLSIIYNIGTYTSVKKSIPYVYYLKGQEYITETKEIITNTYNISFSSSYLDDSEIWREFKELIINLEYYNEQEIKLSSEKTSQVLQGTDRLHIFGSIAYFNSQDTSTDSGYARLEQVDSKYNYNYISDVTNNFVKLGNSAYYDSNTSYQYFSTQLIGGSNPIKAEDIIITDVTPVLWKNLSTLSYTGKISNSYIYRYTDYVINSDGTINLDNAECIISTYTKDTYCQFDGLYEIVIVYDYDNYKDLNDNSHKFYQLFTFIIDNSSPKLTVEVCNDGETYEELGLNKYTNKDVRLSWNIPSYFQNNVYIEINKTYYNSTQSTYNFNAFYKNNQITVSSGNATYVNSISYCEADYDAGKYYVYLKLPTNNVNSYNLNGNYSVTLHYSSNGASSITETFVIDKINIDGLQLLEIIQEDNGSYTTGSDLFLSNQIVNVPFTFRYNQKASGAEIYTYYHKIELTNSSDYDKIINSSDGYGVLTNFAVNGVSEEISSATPYTYNYSNSINVSNNNCFTPNTSCIYLFRMQDQAGNECRYVVFYDTTSPIFLVSPEIDNPNSIVQDTTKVTWGDYKVIKINTNSDYELSLNENIDNYTKLDYTDRLRESLLYLNTSNNFNDAKIELVDDTYYILIPITKVELQDDNSSSTNQVLKIDNVKDYYFFPVNPISEDKTTISLPIYDSYGSAQFEADGKTLKKANYTLKSYSISSMTNYYGETSERYITATYTIDDVDYTIQGAIGTGIYYYSIFDELENYSKGKIWMNLDKTQTLAYGLFDYSENMAKAQPLSTSNDSPSTYSASRIYMSSLASNEEAGIPEYTVTYQYYAYDSSLYSDYYITKVELLNKDNDATIYNEYDTYLQLTLTNKSNSSLTKITKIQLTKEENGKSKVIHTPSYPYDLVGNTVVSDATGAKDIYIDGKSSYTTTEEPNRIFTTTINANTDTNLGKIVTQEGLYIFKRTYTDENIDLGNDTRTIYLPYYVDRSGIINITSSGNVANTLYEVGKDIDFVLGSNSTDDNYKKTISAETIQNNQVSKSSSSSNTYTASQNLFDTNKIQVEFNLTTDKYNFNSYYNNNTIGYQAYLNYIYSQDFDDNFETDIISKLNYSIFNTKLYQNIHKLDLTISKASENIINENSASVDSIYNTKAISKYLKDTNVQTNGERNNVFHFFYGDVNNVYKITLNDQTGYDLVDSDGRIQNDNYASNQLDVTFSINHQAPEGETYGKYYGRHEYDSDLPIDQDGTYLLISKYLTEGQLQPLSNGNSSSSQDSNGTYITLSSTNNETLVFLFTETNDDYMAKIDIENIQIYQGGSISNGTVTGGQLIFNRVNGTNIGNSYVSAERMTNSFIKNKIGDVTYYAIIIFDNNLDEILSDSDLANYANSFRLLDSINNYDKQNYFIKINYVGNKEDYVSQDTSGNDVSYFSTIYEVVVDRIKPTYNLTKLMDLDKYIYNEVSTTLTTSNYETVFNSYKQYYNFITDEEYDYERSDLENYFFAVDYREDSSFEFESVSLQDNNNSIYVRLVSENTLDQNYKFSITPDDYKAYYNALYMQGHPQFASSKATTITSSDNYSNNSLSTYTQLIKDNYYQIPFSLNENGDGSSISINYLIKLGILKTNCYYEIIERDEAENYRVYGIYIPDHTDNSIKYSYQINSTADIKSYSINVNANADTNPIATPAGMNLQLEDYITNDYFIKALINVNSDNLKEEITIVYDPINLSLYATNSKNLVIYRADDTVSLSDYKSEFIELINHYINEYYDKISTVTSSYYSQYGYQLTISIIDRIGIKLRGSLYDYVIDYTVAGSRLSPIFSDGTSTFTMTLPAKTGSTYITHISASKFNNSWLEIGSDSKNNSFYKLDTELIKGFTYTLTRGVYKFVITDNFNRTDTYFYEFGISSSQTGGALKFYGNNIEYTDGYTYTSQEAYYSYDSSVYNIYIKFTGEAIDIDDPDNNYKVYTDEMIYSSTGSYLDSDNNIQYITEDGSRFGIKSVITSGSITTITFNNVKDLSKYHIKTILASTATQNDYKWGDEETDKNIVVYDKKFAIYSAIPAVVIKNLNGNTLDTSEHLNLTEDFELVLTWTNTNVLASNRIDFNSQILLTRTYNDKGEIKTTTSTVSSGYIVTLAGEYTAKVINSLGTTSKEITFTRGEGEISMYAVYAVDKTSSTETKLSPSPYVTSESDDNENKLIFTYYTTDKYFSYLDTSIINGKISIDNLEEYTSETDLANKIDVDKTSDYIDVRVNSNLSIFTEIYKVGYRDDVSGYPFIQYRVYSKKTNSDETYTYRYIKIVFIEQSNSTLTIAEAYNSGYDNDNLLANDQSIIKSTASNIILSFNFMNEGGQPLSPIGDTIFIDRYYNGEFVETITLDISIDNIPTYEFNLSTVGLHQFVIRDLAGRTHMFGNQAKLQVYLINQILYTVNGETPINNQIFNGEVTINVQSELSGLVLYSTRSLGITITRNGEGISIPNNNGELIFNEAGYYTVKIIATTVLSDGTSNVADQEISSTYNFVIVRTDMALRSFNVSNGTGFTLEKLIKKSNGETYDLTDEAQSSDNLLWLTYTKQNETSKIFGNSIYEVTLKSYNTNSKEYTSFTFNVWINDELPVIVSNVPEGSTSKEVISLNYNPGLIYSQVGTCYITVNDTTVATINEYSNIVVETINISQKGTYWIRIISEDGSLISAYKFTKQDPLNQTTKIVLVCVAIGIVVLVVLFLLIRRKGKYR